MSWIIRYKMTLLFRRCLSCILRNSWWKKIAKLSIALQTTNMAAVQLVISGKILYCFNIVKEWYFVLHVKYKRHEKVAHYYDYYDYCFIWTFTDKAWFRFRMSFQFDLHNDVQKIGYLGSYLFSSERYWANTRGVPIDCKVDINLLLVTACTVLKTFTNWKLTWLFRIRHKYHHYTWGPRVN